MRSITRHGVCLSIVPALTSIHSMGALQLGAHGRASSLRRRVWWQRGGAPCMQKHSWAASVPRSTLAHAALANFCTEVGAARGPAWGPCASERARAHAPLAISRRMLAHAACSSVSKSAQRGGVTGVRMLNSKPSGWLGTCSSAEAVTAGFGSVHELFEGDLQRRGNSRKLWLCKYILWLVTCSTEAAAGGFAHEISGWGLAAQRQQQEALTLHEFYGKGPAAAQRPKRKGFGSASVCVCSQGDWVVVQHRQTKVDCSRASCVQVRALAGGERRRSSSTGRGGLLVACISKPDMSPF